MFATKIAEVRRHRGPTWRATPWSPIDSRRSKQESLLRILFVAHSEKLDPQTLIKNLAGEYRGNYRRQLYRLSRRIATGTPLVSALEQTPDALSDEDVLAIRFGTQSGTLQSIYRSLIDDVDGDAQRASSRFREFAYYGGSMCVVITIVISFLLLVIIPIFLQINNDYGLDHESVWPPWALQLLLVINQYRENAGVVGLVFAVFLVWVLLSGPIRRQFRRTFATRWLKPFAQLRSADLLRLLSTATEAGRPLPASISTLARYHFDKSIRAQLLFARNEIEQGSDVWTSLAEANLLSPEESHALAASTSSGSRAWAMRQLADAKRTRVFQSFETMVTLAQPAITLVFAAVTLFLCISVFQFLTHIVFALD